MAKHVFHIPDGPELGGEPQTEVTLRELTGLEYMECLEQSEKTVQVPVGCDDKGNAIMDFKLVPSPNKMSIAVLRARIESIGEIPGPISDNIWKKLTINDIHKLMQESESFDDALAEVAHQGEH